MTLQGDDVKRHRSVEEFPNEPLLCAVRGGHAWFLASDYDTGSYGMMPDSPRETRARVFHWECPCARRKRELWDKVTGECTKDYGGGHLLMSGRPSVAEARKEWVSRLRSRGMPVEEATRTLTVVD